MKLLLLGDQPRASSHVEAGVVKTLVRSGREGAQRNLRGNAMRLSSHQSFPISVNKYTFGIFVPLRKKMDQVIQQEGQKSSPPSSSPPLTAARGFPCARQVLDASHTLTHFISCHNNLVKQVL